MKTRSGFKKVYVIEQANVIFHEFNGEKKRLIIDLSKVDKPSVDEVKSLIGEETENVSLAVAIILKSSVRRIALNLFWNLKKQKDVCFVQAFPDLRSAEEWISLQ